jgi:ABC-type glycerol-3-phosphate transport system substrate-binding protein
LENARFDPLHPNYSQMQELLKNELQAALIGSKSPQEALDAAAAAFDELVAG